MVTPEANSMKKEILYIGVVERHRGGAPIKAMDGEGAVLQDLHVERVRNGEGLWWGKDDARWEMRGWATRACFGRRAGAKERLHDAQFGASATLTWRFTLGSFSVAFSGNIWDDAWCLFCCLFGTKTTPGRIL